MEVAELERKIREFRKEGYTDVEIRQAMRDEGFSQDTIRQAFSRIDNNRQPQQPQRKTPAKQQNPQNNQASRQAPSQQSQQRQPQQRQQNRAAANNQPQAQKDTVKGIELNDNQYTLKQKFIRNKYRIYDSNNSLVLKAKQKLFRLKEHFKFRDENGNTVFDVKAENIMDVAGDYTLVDSDTEEPITVLEKNWTLFTHKWKIRDATSNERLIAHFHTESKGRAAIRSLGSHIPIPLLGILFSLIPHKYVIESPEGKEIGEMKGKLSIRDRYKLEIHSAPSGLKESIIASAIAIDALEGN